VSYGVDPLSDEYSDPFLIQMQGGAYVSAFQCKWNDTFVPYPVSWDVCKYCYAEFYVGFAM